MIVRTDPRSLIVPIPENSSYFDAKPLQFSIEGRVLNADIINARYVEAFGGERAPESWIKNDGGGSIHVFSQRHGDAAVEHLRFDCFEKEPHYHYICAAEGWNERYYFDEAAQSISMFEWVMSALRRRLPEMLRKAHASDSVIGEIDIEASRAALDAVEASWNDSGAQ
jgi:hypothetical protein